MPIIAYAVSFPRLPHTTLFIVLGHNLLSQLNILLVRGLLARASIHNLLPLVVLGLALRNVSLIYPAFPVHPRSHASLAMPKLCVYSKTTMVDEVRQTYSQIEHARLLRGAEVRALRDFGVCVQLEIRTLLAHLQLHFRLYCQCVEERRERRGDSATYVQLLVIARALLASRLELLAHLADLVVRLGEFGGRHLCVD